MISGYLTSQQDFVDLVNSCLFGKKGILELYLEGKSIELCIEDGYIKSFNTEIEGLNPTKINSSSFLLYSLFSMLDDPNTLFTFKTGVEKELVFKLDEPISAKELILQLQLAYQEFKSFLNLIMTPHATFKVLKPFEGMQNYEGKSFVLVILTSKQPLVAEIRKLHELFDSGFLDIGQFLTPEGSTQTYEIDYIVKNANMKDINPFSMLESIKTRKFTGCVSINSAYSNYYAYFNKGEVIALYPYSCDFFDLLLNPENNSTMNIISMPKNIVEKLMLRHSERKLIDGLSHDLVELGKMFTGIVKTGFSGLLTLQKENERMYFMYENGVLLASLLDRDQIKITKTEPYKDDFLLGLIPYEPMENFLEVLHLLLINATYRVILKHSNQIAKSVLSRLSSSDLLKVAEGSIYFRTDPMGKKEEILGFLSSLLDVGYKALGKQKLEEELEISLHPYKEVFKALEVENYTKFWDEGIVG